MDNTTFASTVPAAMPARPGRGRLRRALRWARREPLLHFLVLGALIFAGDRVLNPPDATEKVIVVTQAMRDTMRRGFDENQEREPTPAELNAMVENWVASEILYREGKAMGVDRGDSAIRDRIAFKVQLLIFSQLEAPAVDRTALQAWFEANRGRFDEPERVSFYLAPATTEENAHKQLAGIQAGQEPSELQQKTRALVGRPVGSLAGSFGEAFRDALLALPLEQWAVLRSTEGWHVVRLDSRRPAVPARLEDVEDEAVKIYKTDDTRKKAWDAVQRLRSSYTVRYEP